MGKGPERKRRTGRGDGDLEEDENGGKREVEGREGETEKETKKDTEGVDSRMYKYSPSYFGLTV